MPRRNSTSICMTVPPSTYGRRCTTMSCLPSPSNPYAVLTVQGCVRSAGAIAMRCRVRVRRARATHVSLSSNNSNFSDVVRMNDLWACQSARLRSPAATNGAHTTVCTPCTRVHARSAERASSPTGYARVAATIKPEKSLLDAKPRGKASMLAAILMPALVR